MNEQLYKANRLEQRLIAPLVPYKYQDDWCASVGEKWRGKSSQEAFPNTGRSEEGETEVACPEKDDRKTDVEGEKSIGWLMK